MLLRYPSPYAFGKISLVAVLFVCACATARPPSVSKAPAPAADPRGQVVRDPELEHQVSQLELQVMERDALIESLNARLDQALQEVVGAMGKLRSLATRAEAASAMAEADVALQAVASSGRDSAESRQASRLMQQSGAEFKRRNFGGALYLANQAKAAAHTLALAGRLGNMRPGEVSFAVPVKLRANARANVRTGPGMNFSISYTVDPGGAFSGLSYFGEWIRVTNDAGHEGWISNSLVVRAAASR